SPLNFRQGLSAFDITSGITVNAKDFGTGSQPVTVSITNTSSTGQAIVGGTFQFVGASTQSNGTLSITSTQAGPLLVISSGGVLASDNLMTINTPSVLNNGT